MDTLLVAPLVQFLQSFSAESLSFLLLGVCLVAILILFRLFGVSGLYLYNIIAVSAANIQVLKGVQFSFSHEPVALGTIIFSTTYLCSDILTEHYGKDVAKRGVWLCFAAQILMTIFMVSAIGYPPLRAEMVGSPGTEHMLVTEQAMAVLFTPSPRLLLASLFAFAASQLTDIWLFQRLSHYTRDQRLWLRTTGSTLVSAMVDTVLFSVLAWVIFSPNPVGLSVLFFTYILGTFITRACISIVTLPGMYLSYFCKPSRMLNER